MGKGRLTVVIVFISVLVIYAVTTSGKDNIDYESYVIFQSEGNVRMSIEEFLPGAVMAFMPADYNEETIKAATVMVRTYVVQEFMTKNEKILDVNELDVNYVSTESMKNVLGYKLYNETMKKYIDAADETKGQIMRYNDQVILPLYHMVSAGTTREATEVFGESVPYMSAVECDKDVESKEYLKMLEIEKNEFYKEIDKLVANSVAGSNNINDAHNNDKKDDSIHKINHIRRDSAGYVLEIQIGNLALSGEEFASHFDLNSSNFYMEETKEYVRIITKGQGHGVGMSVFAAEKMAQNGTGYIEILKYFYDGVEVE